MQSTASAAWTAAATGPGPDAATPPPRRQLAGPMATATAPTCASSIRQRWMPSRLSSTAALDKPWGSRHPQRSWRRRCADPLRPPGFLRHPPLPRPRRLDRRPELCPKSTSHNHRCQGVVRRSLYGTSARVCSRLHHRPGPPAPGRRAGACRLLPGVVETASGARADRPTLEQVLDQLRPGDTLVVWKLDRLGRSLRHLVDAVTGLAERGIGFRSLQEAIDTTTPAASSYSTSSPPWPSSNATSSANARPPGWPPPGPVAAVAAGLRC